MDTTYPTAGVHLMTMPQGRKYWSDDKKNWTFGAIVVRNDVEDTRLRDPSVFDRPTWNGENNKPGADTQ